MKTIVNKIKRRWPHGVVITAIIAGCAASTYYSLEGLLPRLKGDLERNKMRRTYLSSEYIFKGDRLDGAGRKQQAFGWYQLAIEASHAGGIVSIKETHGRRSVVLSVTDQGQGIPDSDQEKIFDPFFTNKEGGTGLGLSLSHKIVTARAGRINVHSEQDQGTTFEVVLPQQGGDS